MKNDIKDEEYYSKSITSKTKNSRDDTIVEEQAQDNILCTTSITRETQTSSVTLPIDSPLSNIVPKQIQFQLLISQAHHLPLVSSQQRSVNYIYNVLYMSLYIVILFNKHFIMYSVYIITYTECIIHVHISHDIFKLT